MPAGRSPDMTSFRRRCSPLRLTHKLLYHSAVSGLILFADVLTCREIGGAQLPDVAHDASGPTWPKPGDMAPQQAARTGSPDGGKLRVFISYSRDDLDFADQLNAALDLCGFECVIDRHGISGGEDWKRLLGNLISEADTVVFVLSPTSARSEICAWEVEDRHDPVNVSFPLTADRWRARARHRASGT